MGAVERLARRLTEMQWRLLSECLEDASAVELDTDGLRKTARRLEELGLIRLTGGGLGVAWVDEKEGLRSIARGYVASVVATGRTRANYRGRGSESPFCDKKQMRGFHYGRSSDCHR